MRWKDKSPKFGDYRYRNEFLIFPKKFEGYWYWWEWVTVSEMYLGWRWTNNTEIVGIGKDNVPKP